MKTFFIADNHFGHKNIINYESRLFDTVEQMDWYMVNKWNEVVSKHDKIIVAGDFSFYDKNKTANIIKSLKGYKILIMGNHDKGRSMKWWQEVGFNEVYRYPIIYNEWIVVSHEPPEYMNKFYPYFYIYGHVHSSDLYKTITKQTACVSVERWDYKPIEFNQLKQIVDSLGDEI